MVERLVLEHVEGQYEVGLVMALVVEAVEELVLLEHLPRIISSFFDRTNHIITLAKSSSSNNTDTYGPQSTKTNQLRNRPASQPEQDHQRSASQPASQPIKRALINTYHSTIPLQTQPATLIHQQMSSLLMFYGTAAEVGRV